MKVGIVSDIHCNVQGLDLALEAMGDIDELLCLGDSIFEYQFSNPVITRLRQRRAHIIQGNHEEVFLSPAGQRARQRAGIDPALLTFLAEQPSRRYLDIAGEPRHLVLEIRDYPASCGIKWDFHRAFNGLRGGRHKNRARDYGFRNRAWRGGSSHDFGNRRA